MRAFSLLLDDFPPVFHHAEDRRRYGTYAGGQGDLCNRVYAWLIELDASCTLSMCPTDYAGSAPFNEYVLELGAGLHPIHHGHMQGAIVVSLDEEGPAKAAGIVLGDIVTDAATMEHLLGQDEVTGVAYWEVIGPRPDDADALFAEAAAAVARSAGARAARGSRSAQGRAEVDGRPRRDVGADGRTTTAGRSRQQ